LEVLLGIGRSEVPANAIFYCRSIVDFRMMAVAAATCSVVRPFVSVPSRQWTQASPALSSKGCKGASHTWVLGASIPIFRAEYRCRAGPTLSPRVLKLMFKEPSNAIIYRHHYESFRMGTSEERRRKRAHHREAPNSQYKRFMLWWGGLFRSAAHSTYYICVRALRWVGHVARMDKTRLLRRLLTAWVDDSWPTGGTEMTYGRSLERWLNRASHLLDFSEWSKLPKDRPKWRALITST
jgi:hypothetical protein